MPAFSATVQAMLAGRQVTRARLVEFAFASQTVRLLEGFGKLRTADGHIWSGIGEIGQIGEIESAIGDAAPVVEFTLSGAEPTLIAPALTASDEVKGRDVTVYIQHVATDGTLLDAPYALFLGVMDQMKVTRPVAQNGESAKRTITLTAEGLFTQRGYPPFGWISDRDQNRLYPGDRGLEQVVTMVNKTVSWPQY